MFIGLCIDEGDLYVITEYCENGSLKKLLANRKLDWKTKLGIKKKKKNI